MASISGTTLAYLAIAGVAAGSAAYEAHQQGVEISNQDKRKARVESENETAKQINMRQSMLKALAAQNASTLGTVGTSSGTSFGANALRQIKENQNDLAISGANESAQVSLLDQAAGNARTQGNVNAVKDGLSAASAYYGGA